VVQFFGVSHYVRSAPLRVDRVDGIGLTNFSLFITDELSTAVSAPDDDE
jgi:hypothetical protein